MQDWRLREIELLVYYQRPHAVYDLQDLGATNSPKIKVMALEGHLNHLGIVHYMPELRIEKKNLEFQHL